MKREINDKRFRRELNIQRRMDLWQFIDCNQHERMMGYMPTNCWLGGKEGKRKCEG